MTSYWKLETGNWKLALQRLRARNHFNDLTRDRGLPHLVHVQRQLLDHLARVARGGVHRRHLRGVEGGVRLEKCAKDLNLDVRWQEILEQLLGLRFEQIFERRSRWRSRRRRVERSARNRQQLFDGHMLDHDRL